LSTETIATGEIFNRHNSAMFSAISSENSTPEREASLRKLSLTVLFVFIHVVVIIIIDHHHQSLTSQENENVSAKEHKNRERKNSKKKVSAFFLWEKKGML